MRQLKVRQGATAGLILSVVAAATVSAQSAEHLQTFGYVLAVGLSMTLLATVIGLAINRQSRPPGSR